VTAGPAPWIRGSARRVARRALDLAGDAIRISTAERGTGVYIGPRVPGNANLGDNLLFWAHQCALADLPLRQVHTVPRFLVPAQRTAVRGTVLGGGTLIGGPTFRRGLASALAGLADRPVANIGTGVEDPRMPSTGRPGDDAELRAWLPLLRRLPTVWVRGPQSQRLLGELGMPAEVSGDPVLLFAHEADLTERAATGRIGINLGITGNQWHDRPAELVAEVVTAAQALRREGWDVLFVSVWDRDDAVTAAAARAAGSGAVLAADLRTAGSVRRVMRRLDLLIAQKLHAVVGAACVATPAVALEYRPKCRDFQESVGSGRWCLRTSEVTAPRLVDLTRELVAERGSVVASLAANVTRRRSALRRAATEAYEHLGG
jgi:polysaccharide pyruvyl transferase WcaK-like protein